MDGLPILLFLEISFFFLSLFNNLIYLFGCAGSSLLRGLFSSQGNLRLLFSWRYAGFSLRRLLSLWSMDSRVRGLKEVPLPGSRAQVQQVWSTSLGAPLHVGSSQTRDQTRVSCIGKQILYH